MIKKKTTVKKKAVKRQVKTKSRFALVNTKEFNAAMRKDRWGHYPEVILETDLKTTAQHALNSYLKYNGNEDVKKMSIVEVSIVGTPEVEIKRNIKFKK